MPPQVANLGVKKYWWGYFPFYLYYIFHRTVFLIIILCFDHPGL